MASHLVVFYAATTGAAGPLLGSDEEDIVLLQYLIWDVSLRKTLFEQQYIVRPPERHEESEKVLSQQCRDDFGLSEEYVKAGESLESAIYAFDAICRKLRDEGKTLCVITDGQLHIRQVLHPKASTACLEIPEFYNKFLDIRKEFRSLYQPPIEFKSITDIVNYLEISEDDSSNLAIKSVRETAEVLSKMITDGHRFTIPEVVNTILESGICTRGEEVDSSCVVRARGLPWQSSDQDIAKFFRGLDIVRGGVALCLSLQGRRNGEALVRFVSPEHRDMALKRHKHHIASRYIEVYKATGEDFINVAGGNNNEAHQFLLRGANVIIRMRGLPYDCTAKQVVDFFESGDNGCPILDNEDGVLFVKKPDGRATGDAFVLFASEDDSIKALAKHREIIGSRYIELFRSTIAEVQQVTKCVQVHLNVKNRKVLNRSMDPRNFEQSQPLIAQVPQIPILPPHLITSSSRKDCIRLRGLPYEAQVEHVLDFLGEYSRHIMYQGVHMVINPQGQPSGEAFIQMNVEQSAFEAAHNRHNRYMVFGKKQRYIEVFQCSGEDMAFVMSAAVQPQRTVVSPGMLMWDQSAAVGAGVSPGTAPVPGAFPPLRPPLTGSTLPFMPPVLPQTANGSQVANLTSLSIKPDSLLNHNAIAIRSPLMQPATIGMTPMSQAQSNHLLNRPGAPVSSSSAIHSPLISSYIDLAMQAHAVPGLTGQVAPGLPGQIAPGLASQVTPGLDGQIAPGLSHPGLMMLPHGPKLPGTLYSNYNPSLSLAAASSAENKNNSIQAKNSVATMLQMQYATPSSFPTQTVPSGSNKRPYEQAFASDKTSAMNQIKRTPPRLPTPQLNPGQILPMPGLNPFFTPSLHTQQLGALHPQQLQTLALNPSLLIYPQTPHMYPSM